MRPTFAEVVGTLSDEGLLLPEQERTLAPRLRRLEPALPWYVRGVSGVAGWTAAVFLYAFAWFLHPPAALGLVAGAAALVGAIALRRTREGPFANQLALAVTIFGELLAVHSLDRLGLGVGDLALATLGIELALLLLYPDPLMRFVSTICACVAAWTWIHYRFDVSLSLQLWIVFSAGLALFLLRPRLGGAWVVPVAYGLTVSALGAMAVSLLGLRYLPASDPRLVWGIGAVVATAAVVLLHESKARAQHWLVTAAMLLGLVLLWRTPGVLAATALLGMGFARRDSKLIALGGAFLLIFGAQFYYLLEWSLLVKSQALAASGVLFLALRSYLDRRPHEA